MKIPHWCEVCGKTESLTENEAYAAGWDYPPRIGAWGTISPRTCGSCPMAATLWWALVNNELDPDDPLGWPEHRRITVSRILSDVSEQ